MSTLNLSVDTLLNLSLDQLCQSMNKDTLQNLLKDLPPSIFIQIIWKILGVNIPRGRAIESGSEIAHMYLYSQEHYMLIYLIDTNIFESFATTQQTKFVDRLNFSNLMDQELFFKLLDVMSLRSHIFTLFQICVQIKGYNFPSNFAQKWMNIEKPDNNEGIYLFEIEKGFKLGDFLGDAGWFVESALVLSHTYTIITTKWVCHDRNLKLLKTLQCLAKWLLVASNYYNLDEAKEVLQNILQTINAIEQIEERTLSVSYAYFAVSNYYYVLMEFDEAWSWARKAINKLGLDSGVLKVIVLSHSIKVCCALYKFNKARKLRKQLMEYQDKIDDNICVDLLLNDANYKFNIGCLDSSIRNYYMVLDTARNLFGYYNLHTALILANYALVKYKYDNSGTDHDETIRCISQAIFIMRKIGVPEDNMLLINANLTKCVILQEVAFNINNRDSNAEVDTRYEEITDRPKIVNMAMLAHTLRIYTSALTVAERSFGEKSLVTAKIYRYQGNLHTYNDDYYGAMQMYIKGIKIIESILGKNCAEFAISSGDLAHLLSHYLHYFQDAENIFLFTIRIYARMSDCPIKEFESTLKGLIDTYKELNNMEKFDHYTQYLATVSAKHDTFFLKLQSEITEENCININLSL